MQYFGGKSRIAKPVAEIINSFSPSVYYEPFCGGLWVTQYVEAKTYFLSDANQALVSMYKAVFNGWEPPGEVSEYEYYSYKQKQDQLDPMTAFVGVGCSFSGKWWGGYARNKRGDNYAKAAKNSIMKKVAPLRSRDVIVECCSFDDMWIKQGSVIYCDPPYMETTNGYWSGVQDFWEVMRLWSARATNIISEYMAPPDYFCIEEFQTRTEIRGKAGREPRVEKIFMRL